MNAVTAPAAGRDLLPAVDPHAAYRGRSDSAWQRPFVKVLLGSAGGLLVLSVADAVGRAGHQNWSMNLFFVGVVVIFWVGAVRLLAADATRSERVAVSCVLTLALGIAYFLFSPLMFVGYDELLHQISLWHWGMQRGTIAHNSLMPISPYYPGLEALTLGIRWLTGLPLVVCEMATVLLSRLVLVLAIFFVVERLTRSHRAAGAGVVLYAVSPQFYSFNSSFAYQTLAIALGAGCIFFALLATDSEGRAARGWTWLAIACCWGTVVTHHLIGWMTVALLLAWTAAAAIARRRSQARAVGKIAGAGLVGAMAWTALAGRELVSYLTPILGSATTGIIGLLDASGSRRTLFRSASGTPSTPLWQQAVMLGAAFILVVVLGLSTLAIKRGRTSLRGGLLAWLPIGVALSYLVVLGSRLSPNSAQAGGRLSTFTFFGVAIVVGAWYAMVRRRFPKVLVTAVASLCFLGGLMLGAGPQWANVPGSYLPAADQRSIDAPSVAAARWAGSHLPVGAVVAADRDNGVLMAAIGHLSPESEASSGGANVGPLYFAHSWGPPQTAFVRHEHIQYLVVDQRLASGPPAFGVYFEPGETRGKDRLTTEELGKFSTVAGMQRIYDNGPIQIYSLAGMLGREAARQAGTEQGPDQWPNGINWWLLVPAAGVLAIWVRRWRAGTADRLLVNLLVATLVVMVIAAAVFVIPLPATPIGVAFLVGLGGWGLIGARRSNRTSTAVESGMPRRRVVAVFAAIGLVAASLTIAAVAQAVNWRAPASLAIDNGRSGAGAISVHLTRADGPARVELRRGSAVMWQVAVPPGRRSWTVQLPGGPAATANNVVLLERGKVARQISTRSVATGVLAARALRSSSPGAPATSERR